MAHMLGIPAQDGDRFRGWIHDLLEQGITDDVVTQRATDEMTDYFRKQADKRREKPGDDLISYLLGARINGNPLSDNHFFAPPGLWLAGGINPPGSAIGSCLWPLPTHDAARRRLVSEPHLL